MERSTRLISRLYNQAGSTSWLYVSWTSQLNRVNGVLGTKTTFAALWGVYTIQQTSSKLSANVFKIHVLMLDVCWKFAESLLDVCWIV